MKLTGFRKKIKNYFRWLKLDSEKKQKVFAVVIFAIFFVGLAYVCMQQFPSINNTRTRYQNQDNFTVRISPSDFNKSLARNSTSKIFNFYESSLPSENKETTNMSAKITESLNDISSKMNNRVFQSEKHSRIIADKDNNLFALPLYRNVNQLAENVNKLAAHADKYKSKLFLVQMPTACDQVENLPYGVFDNNSKQINDFLKLIETSDKDFVEIIDLREKIDSDKDTFYPNDSIVLPNIAQKLADVVADTSESCLNLNYSLDTRGWYSDSSNYNTSIHKYHFIGDFTKSLGYEIAPSSDFPIIKPNFETKYTVTTFETSTLDYSESMRYVGTMYDALMDNVKFDSSIYCNDGYLRTGSYCVDIENNSASQDNEFSALVISDGYDKAFTAFLSQYCSKLTFVDSEHSTFDNRIYDLIKQNKYNAVYVLVSDSTYEAENFWNFDVK